MPVSKENIETVIKLLEALDQRQDAIRQLAANLARRDIWRSVDGELSAPLLPSQQEALEGFVRQYAKECRQILAAIDALIGPAPE